MMKVTVVLLEGGLPSTAIAPVEILSSAGVLWNDLRGEAEDRRFRVQTASLDGGSTGTPVPLSLPASRSIDDIEETDLIIVASGSSDFDLELERHARLVPWIREWREQGAAIGAVCSSVVFLAEAGLLDGRPATTHWAVVDGCRRRYPRVHWQPERAVTESDRIFCSGGIYSSIDLSLYLVERYCGHRVAMQTAKALLLQTPRTWQVGFETEPPRMDHDDSQVRDAQEWMFDHFAEDVRVEELASRVGSSPRNFARRFKAATGETPIRYLQRLRINAARHLLENDLKTVRQVSRAVGYRDASFFRRLFKRHTGEAPQKYRERFGTSLPESLAVGERTPHA